VAQLVQTYVLPFTLIEENFKSDPSEKFPFVISAINNEFAVDPDETKIECLEPTHFDQTASNSLTFGPLVNLFVVRTK
jgi:hypothetical protein